MTTVRLYLDEDVFPLLAAVLRERSHDVVAAVELGRTGLSDLDQFEYAVQENRAILTFNTRHFVKIANEAISRRTLRLLHHRKPEQIKNLIVWLTDFR